MIKARAQAVARASMLGLALVSAPSFAADLTGDEPMPPITAPGGFEARWESALAVYAWMPGLTGSVGVAGLPPVNVDLSFSELLENLDMAFMAVGEIRKGRFGVFGDLVYTRTTSVGSGPQRSSVDLMAGARIWNTSADLEVTTVQLDPPLGFSVGGERTWVDPMVGVKGRLQGASPWYLTGWAMAGGFGVSSKQNWDLFGGAGYEVSDRFSLVGGYRALGVDYRDDGFIFDVVMQGPVIGGVFRF
jgi:hypothetical protein